MEQELEMEVAHSTFSLIIVPSGHAALPMGELRDPMYPLLNSVFLGYFLMEVFS